MPAKHHSSAPPTRTTKKPPAKRKAAAGPTAAGEPPADRVPVIGRIPVLDVRPLVHRKLGVASSLCCRPYDVCCLLVAEAAGCVVCDPSGAPLRAPLDVETDVAFAGYANAALAALLQPIVADEVRRLLG